MKKSKKMFAALLLAFVLLMAGAFALYTSFSGALTPDRLTVEEGEGKLDEGEGGQDQDSELVMAPDFTVYDVDGNEVRLSDYVGKPIVLNFWASWCGPCQTVEVAAEFVEEKGYAFPVFYDTAANAAMTYGVYSLPATYFIDAEGRGVAWASGTIDGETLQKGIDMIRPEE